MPYELDHRLVVGIASSALFDLTESHAAFDQGLEYYRGYQDAHENEPLAPGVAFPFIKRLLALNDLSPNDRLVEVFVLSKNDAVTGLRVMRSIESHGLGITRAVFTEGKAPYDYVSALNISLFLSGNRTDVEQATALGLPAGVVLGSAAVGVHGAGADDGELRVAFDFDGVLASDESEQVFRRSGITEFHHNERLKRGTPLTPGPLRDFVTALTRIQEIERLRAGDDAAYIPRVRVSLVTARDAPAHERAVHTLREWGVKIDDAFFLGGVEKARVLRVLQPHIFFDDQRTHLDPVADAVASVLLPYGVANKNPVHDAGFTAISKPTVAQGATGGIRRVVTLLAALNPWA